MPTSDAQGRDWVAERLLKLNPREVVDVGPGDGTYAREMRHCTPNARWTAIEIWEPYVERFGLDKIYDKVVVSDVMDYPFSEIDMIDVVILGDVVEHLEVADARLLLTELKSKVKNIVVSIPIVESFQGECEGNPYEAHLYQWGFDEMLELMTPCSAWRGDVLGRYWWTQRSAGMVTGIGIGSAAR